MDKSPTHLTMEQVVSNEFAPIWMADAKCRDYSTNVFFPDDGAGVARAKIICSTCPVIDYCLEYADALGKYIHAGTRMAWLCQLAYGEREKTIAEEAIKNKIEN